MKVFRQRMFIAMLIVVLSGCGVSKEELSAVISESSALAAKVKELSATLTALEKARDIELAEVNQVSNTSVSGINSIPFAALKGLSLSGSTGS